MAHLRRPLTETQYRNLQYIVYYIERHGKAPMRKEMAAHFGFSENAAQGAVLKLEEKGYVRLDPPGMPRNIKLIEG